MSFKTYTYKRLAKEVFQFNTKKKNMWIFVTTASYVSYSTAPHMTRFYFSSTKHLSACSASEVPLDCKALFTNSKISASLDEGLICSSGIPHQHSTDTFSPFFLSPACLNNRVVTWTTKVKWDLQKQDCSWVTISSHFLQWHRNNI